MLLSQLPHCLPQVVSPTGMIQYVFFTNCLARYLTLHSGYLKMGHLTEGVRVVNFSAISYRCSACLGSGLGLDCS